MGEPVTRVVRIAHVADSQVDEGSRFEEHARTMTFVAEESARRGCEVVLHAGDVFERRSTEREREAVGAFVRECVGFADVVIVGGNHEAEGEVEEIGRAVANFGTRRVFAVERPTVVECPGSGALVACLPWPRVGRLLAMLPTATPREQADAVARAHLRNILLNFGATCRDRADAFGVPYILGAHAMVRGSTAGPDQPPFVGCDLELSLDDLALARAHAIALGHIHRPQEWTLPDGTPVVFSGSTRRTAYALGEVEPKGFVVYTFEDARLVEWERVPTPATPMLLLDGAFVDGAFVRPFTPPADVRAFEIRLRVYCRADEREAAVARTAEIAANLRAAGAADVKLDPVVEPTKRARAPEVVRVTTLAEKLNAYWNSLPETDAPAADRRPGLVSKADTLAAEGVAR